METKEKEMPSMIRSFADHIVAWRRILAAYDANADRMTAAEFLREELEGFVEQALQLKGQQENQQALKQETTRGIREVMRAGQESARRIRNHARSMLGNRSERLAAFQLLPLRDRKVRRGQPDEETPSAPPAAENPPEEPPVE
jgi:hypothetical protein